MLRGGLNNQHGAPVVVIAQAPPSAEDAFAVLPQYLTAAIRIHAVQRIRHHWSDSRPRFTCGTRPRSFSALVEIVQYCALYRWPGARSVLPPWADRAAAFGAARRRHPRAPAYPDRRKPAHTAPSRGS